MKAMKTLSMLAVTAMIGQGAFVTAAFAEPGGKPAPLTLEQFDKDGNGEVTVEEFDGHLAEKAEKWKEKRAERPNAEKPADHQKRGPSPEEMKNGGPKEPKDGGKKGPQHKLPPFSGQNLDTNGDGVISQEEFDAAKEAWKDRQQERREHREKHGDKGNRR